MSDNITPKKRMLAAYRGDKLDRYPIAPEFWYYYPAKLLKVDLITFEREIEFWRALQETFKYFNCEGWGIIGPAYSSLEVKIEERFVKIGDNRYELKRNIIAKNGNLTSRVLFTKENPSWILERPVKKIEDWGAYKLFSMPPIESGDYSEIERALKEVGEDYLLEVSLGVPFFDYIAGAIEGGPAQAILDIVENEEFYIRLKNEYETWMCEKTEDICKKTSAESLFLGCDFSCNSVEGPRMWRRWDKPLIKRLAEITHKYGKLLHIHFHGKCMETLQDFAEIGVDCICPFERPPGGDVTDLKKVREMIGGKVTMNGNVHTVQTLIYGSEKDVEKEVLEILEAFKGEARLIVGTGDQVGKETPEENIWTMIETVKKYGRY